MEHKMKARSTDVVRKSGQYGPFVGAIVGAFPQCGFSAAASNLYAGRIITLGTLIAIYLSTSDEMLPILISEKAPAKFIIQVILIKMCIGIIAGCIIDLFYAKQLKIRANAERLNEEEKFHIHEICENENCKCKDGILKSALKHTLHIAFFLLVISALLNLLIEGVGEETLANFILNQKYLGVFVAGIIGLIPNCAASVVITTLYLQNLMTFGAMMAGLLVGAGVGLIVLFRVNKNFKDNCKIIFLLYFIGVLFGLFFEIFFT